MRSKGKFVLSTSQTSGKENVDNPVGITSQTSVGLSYKSICLLTTLYVTTEFDRCTVMFTENIQDIFRVNRSMTGRGDMLRW